VTDRTFRVVAWTLAMAFSLVVWAVILFIVAKVAGVL
jgi:hypothetical protein